MGQRCRCRSPAPGRSFCFCGVLSIRRGARLLQGGGACGMRVGAPPRGEAFGFAVFSRFAAGARLLRGGAVPTGWCGAYGMRVGAPLGAKLLVLPCACDSPRGAAPTGWWCGACGVCVGARPRGEAFGFVAFSRFAAGRGSYGVVRCLRHACRSPASGRSFWLCGVLPIRRGARLLRGGAVPAVGAPPRGEAFGLAAFSRFAAGRGSYRVVRCLRHLCRSPARGGSFGFVAFSRFAAGRGYVPPDVAELAACRLQH